MSSSVNREYLEHRRDVSLEKAGAATDAAIRGIHREFAQRYERAIEDDKRAES